MKIIHKTEKTGSGFPLCDTRQQLPPAYLTDNQHSVNCFRCKALMVEAQTEGDRLMDFFFPKSPN